MEDQSVLHQSGATSDGQSINEYANECIKEVCLSGEDLSKYQRMIEKRFGADFYEKCDEFVKEVRRSISGKRFSNTSLINLKFLAKEVNIPEETVVTVTNHFKRQFEEEEKQRLEEERRKADTERIRQQQLFEQAEKQRKMEEAARNRKKVENSIVQIIFGTLKLAFILLRLVIGVPLCILFGFVWIIVALTKPERKYKVNKALNNIINFIVNKD